MKSQKLIMEDGDESTIKQSSKKKRLRPDLKAIQQFWKFLHGARKGVVQTLDDKKCGKVAPEWFSGSLQKVIEQLVQANRGKAGVSLAVNRIEGSRKSEDVTRVNALFLDADGDVELRFLKTLNPDLISETSRKHYHCFWKVSGVKRKLFKAMQQALAEQFSTDRSVNDLARAMRIPGTYNWKLNKPFLVRIVHFNKEAKRIPVHKLLKRLGVAMPGDQPLVVKPVSTVDDSNSARILEIEDALNAIKDVSDRDAWLKIGMALHHELPNALGFKLWKKWSVKWPKYKSNDQKRTWEGFGSSQNPRTIRTLFQLAVEDGWVGDRNSEMPHTTFEFLDMFAQRVKDRLCFVTEEDSWRIFKSPVWMMDFPNVVHLARKVVEDMHREARQVKDSASADLIGSYMKMSRIKGLLVDASLLPVLNVEVRSFDANPYLLAVQNGVIDLKTGEFLAGKAEDKLTMQAPTSYDANAQAPLFEKLLDFVTSGDAEYKNYLQHALGYTICGHTNKQLFFIVYGSGSNKKGTLFRVMAHVLGPLSTPISPNLMTKAYSGNPNSPSPAIMALIRARMFQCTEADELKRFDTAFVKQLTGNDELSGRALQGDQTRFTPIGTPWLSTNNLPYVSRQDKAMWRRIQLLPFKRTLKVRDGEYETSLKQEASGILNWLIQGAVQANSIKGMPACKVVEKATKEARWNCDSVEYWLAEKCDRRKDAKLQSSKAFASYNKFCRQQSLPPLTNPQFSRALILGKVVAKRTSAHNEFRGIELRATTD